MPVIALQGIRGGAGVSSVTSGLAWALQQLGESVLVIDFTSDNLLRLHFNMPFDQGQGWARSHLDKKPWEDSILSYTPLLSVLPFGTITKTERLKLENELEHHPDFWKKNIEVLFATRQFRWVLLDLPADSTLLAQQGLEVAATIFLLLTPDANTHIRLHQQTIPECCYFLMNQYCANKPLQKDLYQLWQQLLPNFLPIMIHNDEALSEALAAKKPLGEYCSHSMVASEFTELANWCLINSSGNKN